MKFEEFNHSVPGPTPPPGISDYLRSLWYDAKGDWNNAHEIIQDREDKTAAWIHAFLHRKEGDIANADYWYTKAGKTRPGTALEEEWKEIVKSLL
ncbi:MAG TPA: hypothetical protein VK588_10500 [Chitinophagaceae bacterium]|nr:hypothetical protein [Chitinophagaceae bacterium]